RDESHLRHGIEREQRHAEPPGELATGHDPESGQHLKRAENQDRPAQERRSPTTKRAPATKKLDFATAEMPSRRLKSPRTPRSTAANISRPPLRSPPYLGVVPCRAVCVDM